MHSGLFWGLTPGEVRSKEPFDGSHEVDVDETGEDALKLLLNFFAAGEVDEIVYVQPHCDWNGGVFVRWIVRVVDVSRVDAGVVGVALESHGFQDLVNLDKPVTWAATESVEIFLQQPEFIIFC